MGREKPQGIKTGHIYEKCIKCPQCHSDTTIIDTKTSKFNTIRRRRQCSACLLRFTTFEAAPNPNGVPNVARYKSPAPTAILEDPVRAQFVELLSPVIEFMQFHFPDVFKNEKMPNELNKDTLGWMNSISNDE